MKNVLLPTHFLLYVHLYIYVSLPQKHFNCRLHIAMSQDRVLQTLFLLCKAVSLLRFCRGFKKKKKRQNAISTSGLQQNTEFARNTARLLSDKL